MTDADAPAVANGDTDRDTDLIQAFVLQEGPRGRLARLGPALDTILRRHAYPLPVARLLGECLTLATVLAAGLKFEGIFTLQIKGEGPVTTLVADVTSRGMVRGYAGFDPDALPDPETAAERPVPALLGSGHLAFTVDQGPDTDRYQGIVALTGDTLPHCLEHYFHQSEQIDTHLRLALRGPDDGAESWEGAGVALQHLPDQGNADAWQTAGVLLQSATSNELLELAPETVLDRLFRAEGLTLQDPRGVYAGCRCSRLRVLRTLVSFPISELEGMEDDGVVTVTCQFCTTEYRFEHNELVAAVGEQA